MEAPSKNSRPHGNRANVGRVLIRAGNVPQELYQLPTQTPRVRRENPHLSLVSPKREYGIFVGVRARSGELWVAMPEGARKVRAVRRTAIQERWSTDSIGWVKRVPWHRYRGQEDADGDIPEGPGRRRLRP